MHRPTAATEAATVLVDLAVRTPTVLPFRVYAVPGDDPLAALSRSSAEALAPVQTKQLRARKWADEGIVGTLPPVLAPMPLFGGDGAPALLTGLKATGPGGPTLHTGRRHRDRNRFRLVVLENPADAPATAEGSRALAISALTARQVAADLDRWASGIPVGRARLVDAEAATYRAYATEAEAGISASFAWADDLENPAVTPAFQFVPATLRGYARAGASN